MQLQFLSLSGLFSYTGRPFTGTRPPFPLAPLSSLVPSCATLWLFRSKSAAPLSSFQRLGKIAVLGAERAKSLEKQHFGVQIEQNPSTFGCRGANNPWKNSIFGCRANKIPGKKHVGVQSEQNAWKKQHFWVQSEQNPWEKQHFWVQSEQILGVAVSYLLVNSYRFRTFKN